MRTVFASLLLRECLHPGVLAGTQGGVQGGCCQAEGCQESIFIIVLDALVTMIMIRTIMGMIVIFIAFAIIPTTSI
jgi:hypothetical protein